MEVQKRSPRKSRLIQLLPPPPPSNARSRKYIGTASSPRTRQIKRCLRQIDLITFSLSNFWDKYTGRRELDECAPLAREEPMAFARQNEAQSNHPSRRLCRARRRPNQVSSSKGSSAGWKPNSQSCRARTCQKARPSDFP